MLVTPAATIGVGERLEGRVRRGDLLAGLGQPVEVGLRGEERVATPDQGQVARRPRLRTPPAPRPTVAKRWSGPRTSRATAPVTSFWFDAGITGSSLRSS